MQERTVNNNDIIERILEDAMALKREISDYYQLSPTTDSAPIEEFDYKDPEYPLSMHIIDEEPVVDGNSDSESTLSIPSSTSLNGEEQKELPTVQELLDDLTDSEGSDTDEDDIRDSVQKQQQQQQSVQTIDTELNCWNTDKTICNIHNPVNHTPLTLLVNLLETKFEEGVKTNHFYASIKFPFEKGVTQTSEYLLTQSDAQNMKYVKTFPFYLSDSTVDLIEHCSISIELYESEFQSPKLLGIGILPLKHISSCVEKISYSEDGFRIVKYRHKGEKLSCKIYDDSVVIIHPIEEKHIATIHVVMHLGTEDQIINSFKSSKLNSTETQTEEALPDACKETQTTEIKQDSISKCNFSQTEDLNIQSRDVGSQFDIETMKSLKHESVMTMEEHQVEKNESDQNSSDSNSSWSDQNIEPPLSNFWKDFEKLSYSYHVRPTKIQQENSQYSLCRFTLIIEEMEISKTLLLSLIPSHIWVNNEKDIWCCYFVAYYFYERDETISKIFDASSEITKVNLLHTKEFKKLMDPTFKNQLKNENLELRVYACFDKHLNIHNSDSILYLGSSHIDMSKFFEPKNSPDFLTGDFPIINSSCAVTGFLKVKILSETIAPGLDIMDSNNELYSTKVEDPTEFQMLPIDISPSHHMLLNSNDD